MSIKSGFFNALGHDRRYKAEDWAEYFSSFVGNGIFADSTSNLQVLSGQNMTVKILSGKGWINGYYMVNTGELPLTVPNADGILNRIDRIVMRLDMTAREITVAIVSGEEKSSPLAPELTRDGTLFELGLAEIKVNAGTTAITQAMITDTRFNESICGMVKGVVEQIDTTDLFAQYDAEFQAFKGQLTVGDIATNLQMQTNTNTANIANITTGTTKTNAQKIQGIMTDVTDLKRKGILMYDGTKFTVYNNTLDAISELSWTSPSAINSAYGAYSYGIHDIGTETQQIHAQLLKYSGPAVGCTNVIGFYRSDLFNISKYNSFDISTSYYTYALATTTTARAALKIYDSSDSLLWSENLTPNSRNTEKTLDISTLSGSVRLVIYQESGTDYSSNQWIQMDISALRLLFWG